MTKSMLYLIAAVAALSIAILSGLTAAIWIACLIPGWITLSVVAIAALTGVRPLAQKARQHFEAELIADEADKEVQP